MGVFIYMVIYEYVTFRKDLKLAELVIMGMSQSIVSTYLGQGNCYMYSNLICVYICYKLRPSCPGLSRISIEVKLDRDIYINYIM